MSLPAIVDRLADVPTEYRKFYYKRQDNRFMLDIEPVDGVELGDVAALNAETARLWNGLKKHVRQAALEKAVAEAGGSMVLLEPHLDRCVVDRKTLTLKVLDEDGRPANTSQGVDMTVTDLVTELRANPAFALAFEAPAENREASTPKDHWGGKNFTKHLADVKAARQATPAAPAATLDPRDPDFNFGAASLYAKGHPEREATLIRNIKNRGH